MRLKQTDTGTETALRVALGRGSSARGQGLAIGDDLARSRQFSYKAGVEMRLIIEADRSTPPKSPSAQANGRDPIWLCERLGTIQREAKRARARAVYRSAQDAMALIQRCNNHMPIDWTRVDGRLFILNKLLGQYESGLADIESQIPANDAQGQDCAPAEDSCLETDEPSAAIIARQTLKDLLPHASDEDRTALSRLMDLDLPSEDPAPVKTSATSASRTESDPDRKPAERLEWIMPDLVQDLLALSREYGKIVSVSHTLDDMLIRNGSEDAVKTRIRDGLSDLIAGSLPLQGIGRINLGQSEIGLHISGSGFEPFDLALPERVVAELNDLAEQIDEPSEPKAEPESQTEPQAEPATKRLITDDTEADLRAQLAALMDGGFDGNAPAGGSQTS